MSDDDWEDDSVTNSTEDINNVPLDMEYTGLKLDVDRMKYTWDSESSRYVSSPDTGDNVDGDELSDTAPTHAFVIARTFYGDSVTKRIHAWSPYFLKAARAVMSGYHTNVAWGAKPVKVCCPAHASGQVLTSV